MKSRLYRTSSGWYAQILMLVSSGVCRKTNLSTFAGCQWHRFNGYFDELVSLGYLEFFDGSVVLTEKGKRMVSVIKGNLDFFSKDLNSYFRYG